jgi:O-6-methylguanine DNA methyltransferase
MSEVVATAEIDSPLGGLRLAATRKGLVRLALPREGGRGFAGWLAARLPGAEAIDWLPPLDKARQELREYFEGKRTSFDVPLDLRGTPFQLAVWRALLEIPYGETRSYADLARAVRRPRALRAVGAANGANPIPIIVPCHRVIASSGRLGGYGGGLEAKKRLLALERALSPASGSAALL